MSAQNPLEKYIQEKYGELVGIFEDNATANPDLEPARAARGELDYYSIRTFSTGFIIYLMNPRVGDDFDNGVPRGCPFDQGIKYHGDIRAIQQIRYLPLAPEEDFSRGFIAIFEREKIAIYRITADPDKNGIEKFAVFPRPECLTDADIPQIRSFTWSRDDIRFNFD
jgi:hypothetical protein